MHINPFNRRQSTFRQVLDRFIQPENNDDNYFQKDSRSSSIVSTSSCSSAVSNISTSSKSSWNKMRKKWFGKGKYQSFED